MQLAVSSYSAHQSVPGRISVAIAALNEEQEIAAFVEETHRTIKELVPNFEIILIDDGSQDATPEIMAQLAKKLDRVRVVFHAGNFGLGASYKHGLSEATGSYYMMLCGDGGFPAQSLPAVIKSVGKADIVLPHITNLKSIKTPFRYFVSRLYTNLLNTLFRLRLGYYNGLPLHRVDLLRSLEISSRGFGFQAEILIKLLQRGHSYIEVDVLGAEKVFTSKALRLSNVISVSTTLLQLVFGLFQDRRMLSVSPRELAANPSYLMPAELAPIRSPSGNHRS